MKDLSNVTLKARAWESSMSQSLCVKNDIRGTKVNVTLLCILYNQRRLFSVPSEKQVLPVFVWFPVLHSPSAGHLLLSGFSGLDLKWAPSPGLVLGVVRHIERRGGICPFLWEKGTVRNTISLWSAFRNSLPRWSRREHLCVCLLWFWELNTPFDIMCASFWTLGCFRNDATGSWRKRHCLALETGRKGIWRGAWRNRGEWIKVFQEG